MKLSIVIPTYNRTKLLINLVSSIMRIMPQWVELVILDNSSPNSDLFEDHFSDDINNGSIKFIKHKYNVEGNENILRCFEHAQGEWIWVLGDDDIIYPKTFEIIEESLNNIANKDIFFIHFNWEPNKFYKNTDEIYCFESLFKSVHSLGDLNFISSNIIKRDSIKSFSGLLHFYQLSATPIASIALLGLDNKIGSIILSNNVIVENGFYSIEKEKEDHWDIELVLSCISILVSYPFSIENKKCIIREINKICTISVAFKSTIRQYIKSNNRTESVFTFKEILKLKLIYGSILNKIIIEIISILIFISIKYICKIISFQKNIINEKTNN